MVLSKIGGGCFLFFHITQTRGRVLGAVRAPRHPQYMASVSVYKEIAPLVAVSQPAGQPSQPEEENGPEEHTFISRSEE